MRLAQTSSALVKWLQAKARQEAAKCGFKPEPEVFHREPRIVRISSSAYVWR